MSSNKCIKEINNKKEKLSHYGCSCIPFTSSISFFQDLNSHPLTYSLASSTLPKWEQVSLCLPLLLPVENIQFLQPLTLTTSRFFHHQPSPVRPLPLLARTTIFTRCFLFLHTITELFFLNFVPIPKHQ